MRERRVLRVGDDGEAPRIDAEGRVGLRGDAPQGNREQGEGERDASRRRPERAAQALGGWPPASTVFSTSAQRFPHGLNLLAA